MWEMFGSSDPLIKVIEKDNSKLLKKILENKPELLTRVPLLFDIATDCGKVETTNYLLEVGAGIFGKFPMLLTKGTDTTNKIVIGIKSDVQSSYSREDKGFEHAITNIKELDQALAQGLVLNKDLMLKYCDVIMDKLSSKDKQIVKQIQDILSGQSLKVQHYRQS